MLSTKGRPRIGVGIGIVAALAALSLEPRPLAQGVSSERARRVEYDRLLDEYVRDGLVYYRALKGARAGLDAYVYALAAADVPAGGMEEQVAFWLNAYNALVLQTVIDHYPIAQRTTDYPARSIRQIPGAFDSMRRRVAGRSVTLDEIEQGQLAAFHDPRLYLALGRGALGSGRLRSEAFDSANLDRQLAEVAAECVTRAQCFQIVRATGRMRVSAIFSWRRSAFIELYAAESPWTFVSRSPIERGVLAFLLPQLYDAERAFLGTSAFLMEYLPFDWSLNDLTNRRSG